MPQSGEALLQVKRKRVVYLAADPGFLQLPEQLIAALDLNDELVLM